MKYAALHCVASAGSLAWLIAQRVAAGGFLGIARERQTLSMVFNRVRTHKPTLIMRPGPLRLALDNRTDTRVVPGVKIVLHEGPCLAVTLNDRQDYFGQTVNIAACVQGLAVSHSILATSSVMEHPQVSERLEADGIKPAARWLPVRGIAHELAVYEIP